MEEPGREVRFSRVAVEVDCDLFVCGEQELWRYRSICIDNVPGLRGDVIDGGKEILRLSSGKLIGDLATPREDRAEAACSYLSTCDGRAGSELLHLVLLK